MNLNPFRRIANRPTVTPPRSQVGNAAATLIVYGTAWCGDCHRSRRFLDRHGIQYQWINVVDDDPQAVERVQAINHGRRSVPTMIFPDGSTLTEPSNSELASKLGLTA